jgi:hypothetical protein
MRALALAAQCAALVLVFGAHARAAEPESEETEKGPTSKAAALKIDEAKEPAYPPPYSRWAVIGVGLATTAVSYGAAAGMSYAFPDAPGAMDLRKPIIGPWLAIAHNGCAVAEPECSQVWIVMRSVAEAIGGSRKRVAAGHGGRFMPTQYRPEAPKRNAPAPHRAAFVDPPCPSRRSPTTRTLPGSRRRWPQPGRRGSGVVGRLQPIAPWATRTALGKSPQADVDFWRSIRRPLPAAQALRESNDLGDLARSAGEVKPSVPDTVH